MQTALSEAFDAFWENAKDYSKDVAGLRQAFKNGVAFIVARGEVSGPGALIALIDGGEVHTLQEMWPWIVKNMEVHPDWVETHRDAVIYGGLAALTLFRTGRALEQELEAFQP